MFHAGFAKEYLSVPFIRNDNGEEHLVILQKEMTGRDCNKFMKNINLYNLIDDTANTNIDFNVVVQRLVNKSETNLSFHTWILKNINKNMYIIPNDKSVDVKAKFKYTVCSLLPHINSSDKSCFVEGTSKICHTGGNVMFLPLNTCKFILNDAVHPFYVVVSIVKDMCVYVKENNDEYQKEFNKTAVTLHILVDNNCKSIQMSDIASYLKDFFKIIL